MIIATVVTIDLFSFVVSVSITGEKWKVKTKENFELISMQTRMILVMSFIVALVLTIYDSNVRQNKFQK